MEGADTSPRVRIKKEKKMTTIFFHEPRPVSPVVFPQKKAWTLARHPPLNQPHIMTNEAHLNEETVKPTRHRHGVSESLSQSSRADYLSSVDSQEGRMLSQMFTTSFRRLKNRNSFTLHIYFIMGLQMCFSFIVFFLMLYKEEVAEGLRKKAVLLIVIFTIVAIIVPAGLLLCSLWIRGGPYNILALLLLTVSVTLQFAAISAYLHIIETFMYLTGSLMVVFFIGSLLSSQRKCESTGKITSISLVAISVVVSGSTILCMSFSCIGKQILLSTIISIIITILFTIFTVIILRHLVRDPQLRVDDFVYGTLVTYASITTLYFCKTIFYCCKPCRDGAESPLAEDESREDGQM